MFDKYQKCVKHLLKIELHSSEFNGHMISGIFTDRDRERNEEKYALSFLFDNYVRDKHKVTDPSRYLEISEFVRHYSI